MADHIPTIQSDAPSWEYIVQSGNTNEAAVVDELGVIADIGIQTSTATAVPVKIAGLASISTEALSDFSYFADWVPRVLSNSLINTETQQLVLGTGASGAYPGMTGFTNVSGVLNRWFSPGQGDISGLDTLMRAVTDIRVDSAVYGEVDLIAMHPATWDGLRRTKTTTDAFVLGVLDPSQIGALDSFPLAPNNPRVITNTFIPQGTAVCLDTNLAARYYLRQALTIEVNRWGDTEWSTSSVSFRAEMRSTLAVLRPHAVNIVYGLEYDLFAS
jgi:HK97 family phage major capsid protein